MEEEGQMERGASRFRLASHHAIVAALVLGLLGSSCWLGYALHRSRSPTDSDSMTPDQIEAHTQKDPLIGSVVSIGKLRDSEDRPVPIGSDGILLLFVAGPKMSNCSTCGTEEFIMEFNALARERGSIPTYIVWAGQSDLAGLDPARSLYKSVKFAVDPKLHISKGLNCFLFPRAYLVSGSGRLRYVSPIGEQAREVIRQVHEVTAGGEQSE